MQVRPALAIANAEAIVRPIAAAHLVGSLRCMRERVGAAR